MGGGGGGGGRGGRLCATTLPRKGLFVKIGRVGFKKAPLLGHFLNQGTLVARPVGEAPCSGRFHSGPKLASGSPVFPWHTLLYHFLCIYKGLVAETLQLGRVLHVVLDVPYGAQL